MKILFALCLLIVFTETHAQLPNTWTQKASLPASPRIGAVAFSINGYGYVGTGQDTSGNVLNDFWKYDPVTDAWTQVADFAGSARRSAVAFINNNKGYVGTGYDNNTNLLDFFEYDGSANSWTQVDSLGKNSFTAANPRKDASGFAVNDKGYVVCGYDGTSDYTNECWQFDKTRDTTWALASAYSGGTRRWAIGFSIDTLGFVGCGFSYSQDFKKDFWSYNPSTNTWAQVANFPDSARSNVVAFTIGHTAFVGIGFDGAHRNNFYSYSAVNNTWEAIADYGGGHVTSAVAFSINGRGYVATGADTFGLRNDLWEYTPDASIGFDDISKEHSVSISPVPFHDVAQVKISSSSSANSLILFKLFDAKGNLVREFQTDEKTFTLERKELRSGIYFYSISSEEQGKKMIDAGKIVIE